MRSAARTGAGAEVEAARSTVAVLVRDGVLPMELGLVHQLFGSARDLATGDPLYEVRTCAPRPGRVRTDADFPIHAEHGLEALEHAHTVVVPAAHELDENLRPGALDGELERALHALHATRARLASICTGSFVLAAAGLLDGRRATTHWMSSALFARTFPSVTVDEDVLYVDEGRVLTSAGEAAGIDLCLHMIRADHGAAVAAEVARRTVVPPHREGGQAQYIRRPVEERGGASTAASRAWALTRLDRPLTLAELAARDAMSIRTYNRRFRDETGLTPMTWLARQRVDRARELLERTDHTVDRIAAETGFGTAVSLRQHFQRVVGVSPGAYRATFRGR
ncbi:GlxA family transcriptional regulator [Streptomyces sp. VRA16 Mangrove soil]|uniref:GlxA family transcriptional regulator n=1 Tax=Streptomyces sp. VRA16 Mangrove soil TaxID=2817434 RepID=UPI001A9F785F|nr:helix-turn-helix domain-containing protein [Streptomyces sp. VRA16 Mangrove soil]MBO1337707.1 helix-turn-helix domain-containing protein [Streptomyces sp. VRA16 Mangrove soil]